MNQKKKKKGTFSPTSRLERFLGGDVFWNESWRWTRIIQMKNGEESIPERGVYDRLKGAGNYNGKYSGQLIQCD